MVRHIITGFFIVFILAVQPGSAITIRHDTPDSSYTHLANSTHPQGGLISGSGWIGSGTLISPNWILTAGHVLSGNISFSTAAGTRSIVEQHRHSSWGDIGVGKLSSPLTGINPVPLYDLDFGIEDGQEAIVLGAGNTGTGNSGQQAGTGGTRRAAETYVYANGDAWGWGNQKLLTWFRKPSAGAQPLEGGGAQGDSGGAVLLNVEGTYAIAGVMSQAWSGGSGGDVIGKYDTGGVYIRSAPINDWILQYATDAEVVSVGPPATDFQWNNLSSGNWHNSGSWTPSGIPNGDDHTVVFTGAGPLATTVVMNFPATVREITLDGSSSYRLGGTHKLTLAANTGAASLTVTGGNHIWTAPVAATTSTTIDIATGAELTLEGTFDFLNQTVTKSGSGHLYLDSETTTTFGTFQHNNGFLGGNGALNGDLTLAAATVTPGHGIGQLSVTGDFTMGSGSALEIEIGGTSASQFDTLQVGENAYLNGTLAVALTDNYYPDLGERFSILQATSIANSGVVLGGPDGDKFKLVYSSGELVLESTAMPLPTDFQWAGSSGNWHNSASWTPAGVPNGDDNTVVLTGAGSSVTTVTMNSPATVREINLDGSSSYRLGGNRTLTLDADTGFAALTVTGGSHNWTAPVAIDRSTTIDIAAGAELTLEGTFDFENQTVTKSGAGRLYLDSDTTTQSGAFQHTGGYLGGDGVVNGDLLTSSATVAPGHGIGQLSVTGDFTMGSGSTLEIEIGGTSTNHFDALQVGENAYLNGTLAVTLTDDYYPDLGERFSILQAVSIANSGVVLGGPDGDKFKLVYSSGELILESTAMPLPTDFQWAGSSGSWHNSASWTPAGIPNGNDNTVVLTGAGSSVTTVTMNSPATVREINLDGSSSYRLGGNRTLTLDADTGFAALTVTGGSHNWTAPVAAEATTTIDIATGAELTLEGTFDFENQTVTKSGAGRLYLDSDTTTQSGTFQHNGGYLGGDGVVNGDLLTSAAMVAPGHGIGQLSVTGDFTMGPASALEIEIGGTSATEFDALQVGENAYLNGTLAVTLMGDYYPDLGDRFSVLQAVSIANSGVVLGGPDGDKFKLVYSLGELLLESTVTGPAVLPGDYNSDGVVDAADYTVWIDQLGTATLPNRDPSATGPVGQFDYLVWKNNFGATGTENTAAVPEPASLLVGLWIALIGIPVRNRFR
ncbi:MAG: trypsin-like serine protease [Pirellulales bacterium]|nr:trypsin-like serine protease [Pirellulales bacterium]